MIPVSFLSFIFYGKTYKIISLILYKIILRLSFLKDEMIVRNKI